MSVGKFIEGESIFQLAEKQGVRVLIPSGAIAGIDAIKAAALQRIDLSRLTTRKPIYGFADNAYVQERRINLSAIKKETVLFEGNVLDAIKCFPQNINVAATIALASHSKDKLRIRISTSPAFKVNSHEVEVIGAFGRLVTKTENVVCPDNPKTSYPGCFVGGAHVKRIFSGGQNRNLKFQINHTTKEENVWLQKKLQKSVSRKKRASFISSINRGTFPLPRWPAATKKAELLRKSLR